MTKHFWFFLVLIAWCVPAHAVDPEQDTLRISRLLKPISDARWEEIAGGATTETYMIVRGDSLYSISKRLFGNGLYWPKIWALNNGRIMNPHLIYPGNLVAFNPGTGSSLPSLAVRQIDPKSGGSKPVVTAENLEKAEVADKKELSAGRSQEWKKLPRQSWEVVTLRLPPNYDPQGFDKRNKLSFSEDTGYTLKGFPMTDKVDEIGTIVGSQRAAAFVTMTDIVFIESDSDLKVGELYTLTREPTVLEHEKSDRSGYSYTNLGTVQIIGVREDRYIATILESFSPIKRGTKVVRYVPAVKEPAARPSLSPTEAVILLDRALHTTTLTGQNKFIYINRGSDDGVVVGNIFRAYQHYDPVTEEKITDSDFVVDADLIIIKTSPEISLGLMIDSTTVLKEGRTVVALTNLDGNAPGLLDELPSDQELENQIKASETPSDEPKEEVDELDQLDTGGGLTEDEKKELQQLEDWDGDKKIKDPMDDELNELEELTEEVGDSSAPAPPPAKVEEVGPPPDGSVDDGLSLDDDLGDDLTDEELGNEDLGEDLFDDSGGGL